MAQLTGERRRAEPSEALADHHGVLSTPEADDPGPSGVGPIVIEFALIDFDENLAGDTWRRRAPTGREQ